MEHNDYDDIYCSLQSWNGPQMLGKGFGTIENQRKNGDYPDCCMVEIGHNTLKSPRRLRRLAVTQT